MKEREYDALGPISSQFILSFGQIELKVFCPIICSQAGDKRGDILWVVQITSLNINKISTSIIDPTSVAAEFVCTKLFIKIN